MSEYSREYRKQLREFIVSFKAGKSCVYCEETHTAALDFHHKNPEDKLFILSDAQKNNRSRESIMLEIAKCDLVCKNCHAKLHWNESH